MTNSSDNMTDTTFEPRTPRPASPTRPFYWSVRRELWESRSFYIAPLAVAALVMCGFMISTIGMAGRRREVLLLDPMEQLKIISQPYDFAATALIATMVIIAVAYCSSALYSERRDRSILFWRSMPVSDRTTVLAKAAIPLLLLPIIVAAVTIAIQVAIMIFSGIVLLAGGVSPIPPAALFATPIKVIYGLATLTLWYAPVYAWLLLVGAWAKRSPFLWAVIPPLALCLFEKLSFNTSYLFKLLISRLAGSGHEAFAHGDLALGLSELDPLGFLSTPGLWLGLIFAAACLAGAVWMRRRREPI